PPRSTLFPYTTRFRSRHLDLGQLQQQVTHRVTVDQLVFELVAVGQQAVVAGLRALLGGARGVLEVLTGGRIEVRHLQPLARRSRSEEHTSELQSRENL